MSKKVILTGLRANNDLHIGNYFGALLPMIDMAKNHAGEYEINLFVPDLHSARVLSRSGDEAILGFLFKHRGATESPALSARSPVASTLALFTNRWWLLGMALHPVGFLLIGLGIPYYMWASRTTRGFARCSSLKRASHRR